VENGFSRNCGEDVWGLILRILGSRATEIRVVGEGSRDVITTRESMSQEAGAADFGPEDLAAAAPATTCNGVGQQTKVTLVLVTSVHKDSPVTSTRVNII
jgi:hypothetical protein